MAPIRGGQAQAGGDRNARRGQDDGSAGIKELSDEISGTELRAFRHSLSRRYSAFYLETMTRRNLELRPGKVIRFQNLPDYSKSLLAQALVVYKIGDVNPVYCGNTCARRIGSFAQCVSFDQQGGQSMSRGACASCIEVGNTAGCEYNSTSGPMLNPSSQSFVPPTAYGRRERADFIDRWNFRDKRVNGGRNQLQHVSDQVSRPQAVEMDDDATIRVASGPEQRMPNTPRTRRSGAAFGDEPDEMPDSAARKLMRSGDRRLPVTPTNAAAIGAIGLTFTTMFGFKVPVAEPPEATAQRARDLINAIDRGALETRPILHANISSSSRQQQAPTMGSLEGTSRSMNNNNNTGREQRQAPRQ